MFLNSNDFFHFDFKNFANSWPSAWYFKSFSRSLEQFFLTVGQNNFANKIPFLYCLDDSKRFIGVFIVLGINNFAQIMDE